MEDKKENKELYEKVCTQVENKIGEIEKAGIQQTNIDYLGKLIDVKKDISKINKMKEEEDMYRDNYYGNNYGNYDNYRGGRSRDSRGRYMESGNYGARGYDMKYRGHDYIDDMADNYGRYMESHENGRYGSPESNKSFDYMLQSAEDFFNHLFKESDSPEQIEKIKMTARRIAEKGM